MLRWTPSAAVAVICGSEETYEKSPSQRLYPDERRERVHCAGAWAIDSVENGYDLISRLQCAFHAQLAPSPQRGNQGL